MKRMTAVLASLALLMGLCACSAPASGSTPPAASSAPAVSTPQPAEPAEPVEPAPPALLVGYGRVDITPDFPVPLAGYGNTTERMHQGVLSEEDRAQATCVAIGDEQGNTVLLYTMDLIVTPEEFMPDLRAAIAEATGVPAGNIHISATHTHSGPDVLTVIKQDHPYVPLLRDWLVEAGRQAVDDLTRSVLYTGSTQIKSMNWVRHYTLPDGRVLGDNFGDWSSVDWITKRSLDYYSEADHEMQILRFVREDGKRDVLMVNWQAHPKLSSTADTAYGRENRPLLSSDYVGYTRAYVEEQTDVLFAFYLGCAGNLNPITRISYDQQFVSQKTPEYSKKLTKQIVAALDTLTQADLTGARVQSTQTFYDADSKREENTVYHMELDAISVGPVSFVTFPGEVFDISGMYIKDHSPFDTTFVLSCANGYYGYFPVTYAHDLDPIAYEARSSYAVRGTIERVSDQLVDMLEEHHDAAN